MARVRSFGYAFQGFRFFFVSEVHGRVHAAAAIVALLMGMAFDIAKYDWLWLFSAISAGLMAEIFNSSIEVLVDMVSPEKSEAAGKAKDMAAAAVVVTAVYATLVGVWVFASPIYQLLSVIEVV